MKHFVLLAIAALVVAACGSDSDEPSAATQGDAPVITTDTAAGTVVPENGGDPGGGPTQAANVTGRVTGADGQPIAAASIEVRPLDGQPAPEFDSFRRTDDQGHFELVLQPGAWELTITPAGQSPNTSRVEVPAEGVVELAVQVAPP